MDLGTVSLFITGVIITTVILIARKFIGAEKKSVEYVHSTAVAAPSGASWTSFGRLITGCGIVGFVVALFMDSGVGNYVNLELLFHKGAAMAGSLFVIGLGVFCIAVGEVLNAISRKGESQ